MRLCTGLARAKLTFLSRPSATSGTPHRQRLFLVTFMGPYRCYPANNLLNCEQRIREGSEIGGIWGRNRIAGQADLA
jgi:hypothetical protein